MSKRDSILSGKDGVLSVILFGFETEIFHFWRHTGNVTDFVPGSIEICKAHTFHVAHDEICLHDYDYPFIHSPILCDDGCVYMFFGVAQGYPIQKPPEG